MSRILITVEERGPTPEVLRREHNKLAKTAWDGAGYYWGEEFREKHFTEAGANEYGYRPRTKRYEDRKEQLYGHRDPLVFTGESQQRSESYRVTATRYGAQVSMNVPAINYSRRGWELRKISQPEADVLARVWVQDYDDKAAQLVAAKRTTTG